MARYIDADNLIDELSAACMPIYEKGITGILGDNSSIADIINEQPTADVQEARHGKWRVYDYDTPQCTHCGMWMPFARYRRGQSTNARSITDFCPSCGAKMIAMPMCETCKYGNGEWKDDGICFACRGQVWIPGKPHRQVGNEA